MIPTANKISWVNHLNGSLIELQLDTTYLHGINGFELLLKPKM